MLDTAALLIACPALQSRHAALSALFCDPLAAHAAYAARSRVNEGLRLSFLQVISSTVLQFPAQNAQRKSLWDMSAEIYRQTKLGDSLVSALEVLVESDKITAELAIKVLSEVCCLCGRLPAACMRYVPACL